MNKDTRKILDTFRLGVETSITDEEKHLITQQDLVLTDTTRQNMERILYPIAENRNIVLIGDAGVGKNAIIYYINCLRGLPTIRFSFNQDTLPEDLIGSFEILPTGFEWKDGPLVQAMKNGYTFVADEMNLASPEILKRFIQVLKQGQLNLLEKDGSILQAHPRFHFVATQNPSRGFEGRKLLPQQLQCLFTIIYLHQYPLQEEVEIMCSLFPMFSKERITMVLELQRKVESAIWGGKIGATGFEHYHFNIRTGQRFWSRLKGQDTQTSEEVFLKNIFVFYVDCFPTEADRRAVLSHVSTVCTHTIEDIIRLYRNHLVCSTSSNQVQPGVMGTNRSMRADLLPITVHRSRLIESMYESLVSRENLLLEAKEGVRVSELVDILAAKMGKNVRYICLSKGMHTSDIIGAIRPSKVNGKDVIQWRDGPLTEGLSNKEWIIIENIEAVGNEVIEKLNMLLDDASKLLLPPEANKSYVEKDKDTRIIAIKYFRRSRSQGTISRALRNRFFSVVVPEIPTHELLTSLNIAFQEIFGSMDHSEDVGNILEKMVEFHKNINLAILSKDIAKDLIDVSLYREENLLRWLEHIFQWLEQSKGEINVVLYSGIRIHYLSSLPSKKDHDWCNELWKKIVQGLPLGAIYKKLHEAKKKNIQINKASQDKKKKAHWDPAKHFRKPNTGKARPKLSGSDLKKGQDIDTPETGGNIKEGANAWYGSDTFGNKGQGMPQGGTVGAWGYRTEEAFQAFLKKYKPIGSYDMGFQLKDYYATFGKILEELHLELDNSLNYNKDITKEYRNHGNRLEMRKYINFVANKGNNKVFLKSDLMPPEKYLNSLECVFLINKGRRLFNLNDGIGSIVALQSAVEVLTDKKIPVRIFGYSDFTNSRQHINLEEYTQGMDTTSMNEITKESLFDSMINDWDGDTVEEHIVLQEVHKFFSPDAMTRLVVILSDFRGHRARRNIHSDIYKPENQALHKVVKQYSKQNYVFLGVQTGDRDLAKYLFEHYVWIHGDNFDQAPLILAEKLQQLFAQYCI